MLKIVKALSVRKPSGQNYLPSRSCHPGSAWIASGFLLLVLVTSLQADQFDALRLYWQTNLISDGGNYSSIASTANGYWNSMNTNASRTYLWSDLPFGSVSANLVSTYQRLQAMALAWATPGSSLQGNVSLASAVADGLDWMNANVYTTSATEYDNWFHWEISGPQASTTRWCCSILH